MAIGRIKWATDESEGGAQLNAQPASGSERKFTQEELDAIVGDRAKRAKGAAQSELLSELGFEKVDDLKAMVKAAKDAAAAQQTEGEKLKASLADYQKREAQWAAEKRAQALQIAVQAAAQKLGIVDAEVALALIGSGIEYDEKGVPQGVEAKLAELVKAKPFLKAQPNTSPTNPPRGGASALSLDAIKNMTVEEINANWDQVQAALAKG
jgi:hypothetical protein